MDITPEILDPQQPSWVKRVTDLRTLAGAPHNPQLLPPHFVAATVPEIGGRVFVWQRRDRTVAIGLSLPALNSDGTPLHLLRCHRLEEDAPALADLGQWIQRALHPASVKLYEPDAQPTWPDPPLLESVNGVDYARPSVEDAEALRALQAEVWQAETDNLYPTYIHHPAFSAVFSLVARLRGQVIGFLLGFIQTGAHAELPPGWPVPADTALSLESQSLGIHSDFRHQNIAFHLKRIQAQEIRKLGIQHVQWVTDPLQHRNARLNYGRLGAVSCQFLANHLPFRNRLNLVRASRVRIVWPIASRPVQQALARWRPVPPRDLAQMSDLGWANDGLRPLEPAPDTRWLALEIPHDWTWLQQSDLERAQAWRDMSDGLLSRYIGPRPGQYMLSGTGYRDGRVFLVAERVTEELVARFQPPAQAESKGGM